LQKIESLFQHVVLRCSLLLHFEALRTQKFNSLCPCCPGFIDSQILRVIWGTHIAGAIFLSGPLLTTDFVGC